MAEKREVISRSSLHDQQLMGKKEVPCFGIGPDQRYSGKGMTDLF